MVPMSMPQAILTSFTDLLYTSFKVMLVQRLSFLVCFALFGIGDGAFDTSKSYTFSPDLFRSFYHKYVGGTYFEGVVAGVRLVNGKFRNNEITRYRGSS